MAIPTAHTLEIEFVPGGWTNIAPWCATSEGIEITNRGKPSVFDDIGPSVLSFTLDNHNGAFTPDSPLSQYYPNLVEGKQVRYGVTVNGQTSRRFVGFITSIDPVFYAATPDLNRVKFTASDKLFALSRAVLGPTWIEEAKRQARTDQPGSVFAFAGPPGAREFENQGSIPFINPAGLELAPAQIVSSGAGFGSFMNVSADGIFFDGAIEFAPSPVSPFFGPTLKANLLPGAKMHQFWFKLPVDKIPPPGNGWTVFELWATEGTDVPIVSLRVTFDGTSRRFSLFHGAAFAYNFPTLATYDNWVGCLFKVDSDPTKLTLALCVKGDNNADFYSGLTRDIRSATVAFFGGSGIPNSPGKNTNCGPFQIGAYSTNSGTNYSGWGFANPNSLAEPGNQYIDRYIDFVAPGVLSNIGSDVRKALYANTSGQNALDQVQVAARTIGAAVWARPDGAYQAIYADAFKSNTLAFSVSLGRDDTADLSVSRGVDAVPTVVTVNTPATTVTVKSADALVRRDSTIETFCVTATDAAAVGAASINRSTALKVDKLTIDLVTALTPAVTSAMFALRPGHRFAINDLPPQILGVTGAEFFAVGWSEKYGPTTAEFTIFTEPADIPPLGQFDSQTFGRFGTKTMTATGGTALETSVSGTLVLDSGAEPPLTVDPAMFPMDLDVGGERVTVAVPPASAVSPQTVTVTARGVAPTVAQAHIPGVPVDIWRSLTVTF